jgi:hypothetical protein
MAYNFLGDDLSAWAKSSLQVYSWLSGSQQYIGRVQQDISITPVLETIEFWDNTSGVQSLYILDVNKADFSVDFKLMQVLDKNALTLYLDGTQDNSDVNNPKVYFGSNPPTLQTARWDFVGLGKTKRQITLTILNGVAVKPKSMTVGAGGKWWEMPITVRALIDSTQPDKTKNLAYFTIGALATS